MTKVCCKSGRDWLSEFPETDTVTLSETISTPVRKGRSDEKLLLYASVLLDSGEYRLGKIL